VLSAEEIARIPEDYRASVEAMNKASVQERGLWAGDPAAKALMAREYAGEIAYAKAERGFLKELKARNIADESIIADATNLFRVYRGQELPRAEAGRYGPMGEAVYLKVQGGMGEIDAVLDVVARRQAPTLTGEDAVAKAAPRNVANAKEMLAEIFRRGKLSGEEAWAVGGKDIEMGPAFRAIEANVLKLAEWGRESDMVILSGDKSLLNAINNIFGMEWGDIGLAAYREIIRLAVADVVRPGEVTFLMRPSPRGDETISVLVLKPGSGERVRSLLHGAIERATERVLTDKTLPFAERISRISHLVREPRTLVAASAEAGLPIQIRKETDGSISAKYADGTDAFITRPDGTVEFLTHAATAADDPAFAGRLRRSAHVRAEPNIVRALEPVERARVEEAWGRRSAPRTGAERIIVSRTEEVLSKAGADPDNPSDAQLDAAFRRVADEKTNMSETETLDMPGVAFEMRLSVSDPAVLADMEPLLPQTGKGIAEIFNNSFGIRGVNTFLGHDGANAVINVFDGLVARYVQEHGLRIRRLGTLKYVIGGGTAEQAAALFKFVNDEIARAPGDKRIGFSVSARSPVVPLEAGTSGKAALTRVSNGHLVVEHAVERRGAGRVPPPGWTEESARATDWDGETQRYDDANALVSAFNSRMATEPFLKELLGGEYDALRPVIELIRKKSDITGTDSIRNFEDLVVVLRTSRASGLSDDRGRALEGAFRKFVVGHGGEFRARLREAVPALPAEAGTETAAGSMPESLSGMPRKYRAELGLDEAPAINIRYSEPLGSGSGSVVYAADMEVDGRPARVAVKIYRNPDAREWGKRAADFKAEVEKATVLGETGLGPKAYGPVDTGGNMAFAMEVIEGSPMYIDEIPATLRSGLVSDATFDEVARKYDALIAHGYEIGDFDFMVTTQDVVDEKGSVVKRAGSVVFLDAEGMRPIQKGQKPRFGTARAIAEGKRAGFDSLLAMERYEHMGAGDRALLDEVSQAITGGSGGKEGIRQMMLRGLDRKKRETLIREYLEGEWKRDPPKAGRMENALGRLENESGIVIFSQPVRGIRKAE
jgi:hypothetical protein